MALRLLCRPFLCWGDLMLLGTRFVGRHWLWPAALCVALLPRLVHAQSVGAVESAEAAARDVMDAFLAAFNARDEAAWADTLLFPHVRLASGEVLIYRDRGEFLDAMDLSRFAEETGWDHSTWDDMQVIHSASAKVHIAVTFSRFDAEGAAMASYRSFYVVERANGRWGVRARSSFAP